MLGCIVEMVDKCKAAINGLREQWQPCNADRLSVWMSSADIGSFRTDDPLLEVNRRAGGNQCSYFLSVNYQACILLIIAIF